jgi:hypothetical protein
MSRSVFSVMVLLGLRARKGIDQVDHSRIERPLRVTLCLRTLIFMVFEDSQLAVPFQVAGDRASNSLSKSPLYTGAGTGFLKKDMVCISE